MVEKGIKMPTEVGMLESMYHNRSENLPFNYIAGAGGENGKGTPGAESICGSG